MFCLGSGSGCRISLLAFLSPPPGETQPSDSSCSKAFELVQVGADIAGVELGDEGIGELAGPSTKAMASSRGRAMGIDSATSDIHSLLPRSSVGKGSEPRFARHRIWRHLVREAGDARSRLRVSAFDLNLYRGQNGRIFCATFVLPSLSGACPLEYWEPDLDSDGPLAWGQPGLPGGQGRVSGAGSIRRPLVFQTHPGCFATAR